MNLIKMIKSFVPALTGIKSAFLSENNLRIHILAAMLVSALGFYFHLMRMEWLLLIFAIGLVLITEYLNTAVEKLTDMVAPEFDERAGIVKDISAGAVLIAALTAVAIGVIVFFPYIM
ncbi:MAG: diacylglycerol kinase family protein [Chitinophagales bacterium]